MGNWYPNLDSGPMAQAIRRTLDRVYEALTRAEKLERSGFISAKEAEARFGAAKTQQSLRSSGATPLNVTGLTGLLAQPQRAYVPTVTALPDPIYDPISQNGALVRYNGALYWFDATTEPGQWKAIVAQPWQCDITPAGPIDGTNATYTLPHVPNPVTSLMLFKNGQLLLNGAGYTLAGAVITIQAGYILDSGDTLRAWYETT